MRPLRARDLALTTIAFLGAGIVLAQAPATPAPPSAVPPRTTASATVDGGVPDLGLVQVEDGHTGEIVLIPAAELGDAPPVDDAVEADLRAAAGMPPRDVQPTRWDRGPSRCSSYGRRRYCDGPLRVPVPTGPEAETATRLGLGTRSAGAIALAHEPRPTWLSEVRGLRFPESILWPVDGGSFVRGLLPDRRVRVVSRRGGRRVVRTVTRPGHNGVDIAAPAGTHALCVADGLVVYARNEMRGYGNVVLVLHGNGTISLYGHLRAAWVFPGQEVIRGQVIGEVGDTGLATGPHLHFEWRRNGAPLNPVPRFTARPRRAGEPEPPPLDLPADEAPPAAPEEPEEVEDEDALIPETL